MKAGGAEIDKLQIRYYSENYRGQHAKCDMKPNDIVLYIPYS